MTAQSIASSGAGQWHVRLMVQELATLARQLDGDRVEPQRRRRLAAQHMAMVDELELLTAEDGGWPRRLGHGVEDAAGLKHALAPARAALDVDVDTLDDAAWRGAIATAVAALAAYCASDEIGEHAPASGVMRATGA